MPPSLIACFTSGIAKNARAASLESNAWVTMTSLGFSIERRTWWARTPCSAWIGAKPSYASFHASKSATGWRTTAIVFVMSAPFRSDAPLRMNGLQEKRATRRRLAAYSSGARQDAELPLRAANHLVSELARPGMAAQVGSPHAGGDGLEARLADGERGAGLVVARVAEHRRGGQDHRHRVRHVLSQQRRR